jgi:hypothetical protein
MTLHTQASSSSHASLAGLNAVLEAGVFGAEEGATGEVVVLGKIWVETNEELRVRVVELAVEDPALEGIEEGFGDLEGAESIRREGGQVRQKGGDERREKEGET